MQPNESTPLALLELAATTLDITSSQREQIERSYQAVGEALCESEHLAEHEPIIEPHGSVLLGTVVKPAPDASFDVDATCHLPFDHAKTHSGVVYSQVFNALREHGTYKEMVKPKNRCVRVEYANSFHLDMTPCVTNHSRQHAIHVPDRELKVWKPSNPKLYAEMFEVAAKLDPVIENEHLYLANARIALSARIEPLPPEEGFRKRLLKRLVQMFKRHRNIYFEQKPGAVISIILTTLAAKSYTKLVAQGSHPSLLEFAIRVVDDMPNHIKIWERQNGLHYEVANPAVDGENFADKWSNDPSLPAGFNDWQKQISNDLRAFRDSTLGSFGTPYLIEKVARLYGDQPAKLAATDFAQRTADSHKTGSIYVSPSLGLGTVGVKAKPTAYFGR